MDNVIEGKITQVFPLESGVSKAGKNWKKQCYTLETNEQYPKKVFFHFFGEKADQYVLKEGQVVKIYFDVESREFNGRWYTDISAWKAEGVAEAAPQQQQINMDEQAQAYFDAQPQPQSQPQPNDELPF